MFFDPNYRRVYGLSVIPTSYLTHCYFIAMCTVNTYSGVARLMLRRVVEKITMRSEPPNLFLSYMWVGWLGRVFMWCEKIEGTTGCLDPFWLKPSSLSPLLFLPPSTPWSPLRGDGGEGFVGYLALLTTLCLVGFGRCLKMFFDPNYRRVYGLSVIPTSYLTHCYFIAMCTVNTYSGVARLMLRRVVEKITMRSEPPNLFSFDRVLWSLQSLYRFSKLNMLGQGSGSWVMNNNEDGGEGK